MANEDPYEKKFSELLDRMSRDQAFREAFQKDPAGQVQAAGIPLLPAIALSPNTHPQVHAALRDYGRVVGMAAAATPPETEHLNVALHWWGVDFVMNNRLTEDISGGVLLTGALGGIITTAMAAAGVLTGPIGAAIGTALAMVIAVKKAEIDIMNNGRGIHWPITWAQWGALTLAGPIPPAIAAIAATVVHPLRN